MLVICTVMQVSSVLTVVGMKKKNQISAPRDFTFCFLVRRTVGDVRELPDEMKGMRNRRRTK